VGEPKDRSGYQRHDYRAVVNIGGSLERVVPMIKDF
jgi:hypothetical protein